MRRRILRSDPEAFAPAAEDKRHPERVALQMAAGDGSGDNAFCGAPAALLVERHGGRYSRTLGIDLDSGNREEIFKWFLASVLMGARISENLAVRTFHEFVRAGLTTPEKLLDLGWDGLVAVLDRGGYVRYDFKTATKLLEVAGHLRDRCGGDLAALHAAAEGPRDLEQRIRSLGKGIGEVTVNIFLREMRTTWSKAEPPPSDLVLAAAKECGFVPADVTDKPSVLCLLRTAWAREGHSARDFADFEAALLRLGLQQRRIAARNRVGARAVSGSGG